MGVGLTVKDMDSG